MGAYLRPFRRMGTMGTGNRDLVAPPLVRFLKNDKMDTVPSASDPEPEFSPGMGRGGEWIIGPISARRCRVVLRSF